MSSIAYELNAQNFSSTFDEIDESFERGKGMVIDEVGNIYCTAGLVCQDLTQSCVNVYKFDSSGTLLWSTLLDDKKSLNWENIQIENDSVYIGVNTFTPGPQDYCGGVVLNVETGEELRSFTSQYYNPSEITLAAFGQLIYGDLIYMYGGSWNHQDDFDGPGYVHIMDKQGKYLDHLEYRQNNFNGIYQLMEGPEGDLYFLNMSTPQIAADDDYHLVRWHVDSGETEVVKHLPFQGSVPPYYTILSDRFIMTKHEYDFQGQLPPLFALVGVSFDGEVLWQYNNEIGNPFEDLRQYEIYEMAACANDDFLICGEYDDESKNDAGFIMRFNKEGELLWERHYRAYDDFGSQRESYLTALREMPDGSIVAIGGMQQVREFQAEEDFWILKVDADGCYQEGENCDDLNQWLTSTEELQSKDQIGIYPNPTSGDLTIDLPEVMQGRLSVRDVTGQVVISRELEFAEEVQLDLSDYHTGMYVVEVVSEDGDRYVERVVVTSP